MDERALEWLKANRCPWCVHGRYCKGYAAKKLDVGWKCHGYRSKYDEVPWKPGEVVA